jgi:hypothetical protein
MRIPPSSRRRGKLSRPRAAILSVKGSADLRQSIRCPVWRPQRRQRTGRLAVFVVDTDDKESVK